MSTTTIITSPVPTSPLLQPKTKDTQECSGWILSPSCNRSNSRSHHSNNGGGQEQQPFSELPPKPASILLLSPPRTNRIYPPIAQQQQQQHQQQHHRDWFFYYSPPSAAAATTDTSSTDFSPAPPATISILSPAAAHGRGVQWPSPPHWPTTTTASEHNNTAKKSLTQEEPQETVVVPQLPEWPLTSYGEEQHHHLALLPPIWHSSVTTTANQEHYHPPATLSFPELPPPRSLHYMGGTTSASAWTADGGEITPPQLSSTLRPCLFPRQQPLWTCPVVTRQTRIHAMVAIRNLSSGPDHNKAVLGRWTPILDTCKKLLQDSSEVALRQHAAIALRNLSQLQTNHSFIVAFPGLLHALAQALRSSCDDNMCDLEVSIQACWALAHLTTAKQFKAHIFRSPGLMQALLAAVYSSSKELVTRALSVLSNLAIGYENKWDMYFYPGLVPAILNILSRAQPHTLGNHQPESENSELFAHACSILWSLAAEKKVQRPMVQNQPHVVLTLLWIVGQHAATGPTIRSKCWAALCLLAESLPNVMSLIRAGIVQPLLEELQQESSGDGSGGACCSSWCVSCLMNLAQVEEGATVLRHAGAVKLLEPMVVIAPSTSSNNNSNNNGSLLDYASLKAAMAVALICKTDNIHERAMLMDEHYHLFRKMEATLLSMTCVLYNTLAGRGGPGYKYGVFSLPCVVACMAALTTGPAFWQEHVCVSIPLQTQLLQVLWDFAVVGVVAIHPIFPNHTIKKKKKEEERTTALVGGGPHDEASAKSAIQALHAMVVYQYEHACLEETLRAPLVRALLCSERRLSLFSSSKHHRHHDDDRNKRSNYDDIRALAVRTRQLLQGHTTPVVANNNNNNIIINNNNMDGDQSSVGGGGDGNNNNNNNTGGELPKSEAATRAIIIPRTPTTNQSNTKKRPAIYMSMENSSDNYDHHSPQAAASPTCVIAAFGGGSFDSSSTTTTMTTTTTAGATPRKGRPKSCNL